MKTALTELIERLERHSMELKGDEKTIQADGAIRMCIIEATELLEKEREQIEEAYDKGFGKFKSAEQYFNETFKQQPEVDYQKMFANCSLPNEEQPEKEEVDALQYNDMVQFLRKWKVDSDAIADLRGLIKSTLNQDKELRETWNNYKNFLKEKYPAEDGQEWKFVCKHHQQIDDLLNSKKH